MNIRIAAFTEQGIKTAYKVAEIFPDNQVSFYLKNGENSGLKENLSEWTRQGFLEKDAIVFVGAMGIAVRKIAPFIESKLTDSPVVVVDELGNYVIPVLSGHVGGANEIAMKIAEGINATPVITTATDINEKFAVDVFAVKSKLRIYNKDGIKKVSSKVLANESLRVSCEPKCKLSAKFPDGTEFVQYPPQSKVDVLITKNVVNANIEEIAELILIPKTVVLGIGCKKDKELDAVEELVAESNVNLEDVYAIASIDIKKDEAALVQFANRHKLDFITFSKEELLAVEGNFSSSEFVMNTVGVDNVCERAALAAAGADAVLIKRKTAKNGVTLAVAQINVENI